MKIGLVCSGGDAPGINPLISTMVTLAQKNKYQIIGFYDGFDGILDQHWLELTDFQVGLNRLGGGSIIGCERSERFKQLKNQNNVAQILKNMDITHLIILGGNGTFIGALKLLAYGIYIHFVPLTIDNDLAITEYALGFDTCLNTILNCVRMLHDSLYDHQRLAIIEVMGRNCPTLAELSGLAVQADLIITQNNYQDDDMIINQCNDMLKYKTRGKTIIISENITNIKELGKAISDKYNIKVWPIILAHLQRGGLPTFKDCLFASETAQAIMLNIQLNQGNLIYDLLQTKSMEKFNKCEL